MNLSYDIFDLVEFPIIITDKKFVITYKNSLAYRYFRKLRKRSKISSYARDLGENSDFSHINAIDVETGTQFMRALAIELDESSYIFLFLTLLQFNKSKNLIEHISSNFSGNFVEFYLAAHREYMEIQSMKSFEKATVPERAYVDLLQLVRASAYRPDFMQAEVHDIAQIVEHVSHNVGRSFGALGLKMPSAKISDDAKRFCKCHINLPFFSFIIFRMIYTAFRLSVDGTACMDLEYLHTDKADVCVYARTAIDAEEIPPNDFVSLIKLLPEFALEFTMLQKIGILGKSLSFSFEDSILKLHYQTKCAHGEQLILRSDRPERKMELIAASVAHLITQTKELLSKNLSKEKSN